MNRRRAALTGVRRIPCEREREPPGRNATRRQIINESLDELNGTFHRLHQSGIDEELFDVISDFEALTFFSGPWCTLLHNCPRTRV
jgi:hypothetical protein